MNVTSRHNVITIVTKNSGNIVHLNGEKVTETATNTSDSVLGYLYFNKESETVQTPIDLYIATFKIYNRALTEEEIQHNYLYEQSIERGE